MSAIDKAFLPALMPNIYNYLEDTDIIKASQVCKKWSVFNPNLRSKIEESVENLERLHWPPGISQAFQKAKISLSKLPLLYRSYKRFIGYKFAAGGIGLCVNDPNCPRGAIQKRYNNSLEAFPICRVNFNDRWSSGEIWNYTSLFLEAQESATGKVFRIDIEEGPSRRLIDGIITRYDTKEKITVCDGSWASLREVLQPSTYSELRQFSINQKLAAPDGSSPFLENLLMGKSKTMKLNGSIKQKEHPKLTWSLLDKPKSTMEILSDFGQATRDKCKKLWKQTNQIVNSLSTRFFSSRSSSSIIKPKEEQKPSSRSISSSSAINEVPSENPNSSDREDFSFDSSSSSKKKDKRKIDSSESYPSFSSSAASSQSDAMEIEDLSPLPKKKAKN